jgi:hypothetical protein
MRKLILAVPLALIACADPNRVTVGVDQVPEGSKCTQSAVLNSFIGQTASAQLGAQMMAAARAPKLRWVAEGAPMTMEHSASRLTVQIDAQSRVVSAFCG